MRWLYDNRERLLLWSSVTANLITILLTAMAFGVGLFTEETPAWVFGVGYTFYSLAMMGLVGYAFATHHKASLDLQAKIVALESAHRDLHLYQQLSTNLLSLNQNLTSIHKYACLATAGTARGSAREEMNHLFHETMDNIAAYLTTVTGHQCASCIKVFAGSKEFVSTFCRDRVSKNTRGGLDGIERFHTNRFNTAFNSILNAGQRCFVSNNLPAETSYWNERQNYREHYQSAVVIPITQEVLSESAQDYRNLEPQILGFLCVDAKEIDAFTDVEETVKFLNTVAEALSFPLVQYQSFREEGRQHG